MKKVFLLLMLASSAHGAQPIVREGSTCPPGYYRNSEYCIPARPDTKPAISREGQPVPHVITAVVSIAFLHNQALSRR